MKSDYRIRSDTMQVMVEKRSIVGSGKFKGEEKWLAVSYHSTMKHAVRWLLDRIIRDETSAEGCGWKEVLEAAERAHAKVHAVLSVEVQS